MATKQNYINHIAFVVDASSSMSHLTQNVIQLVDNQVKSLSNQSQVHDQETRATVYTFNSSVTCVYYDKDVMRLPSLKTDYRCSGLTALCAATLQAIRDLKQTATLYGDHSFLIFVITDGDENASGDAAIRELRQELQLLPPEWTLGVLVPNQSSRASAIRCGFPADCIDKWDASAKGLEEVAKKLDSVASNYMQMRGQGTFRGTKNVFSLSPTSVKAAVKQGSLSALNPTTYSIYTVPSANSVLWRNMANDKGNLLIRDYVEHITQRVYLPGSAYYELSKRELVQASKKVAILEKSTNKVFSGDAARQMLNLPNSNTRISPEDNDFFDVFIQSSSTNRHLVPGKRILVFR